MRSVLLLTYLCISFPLLAKDKDIPVRSCKIMHDAIVKKMEPKKLCDKYKGSFCSSMKTVGQGICAAHKESFCDSYEDGEAICKAGKGSFCSSMKTVAAGICAMLGESFCSDETDQVKWEAKLAKACYWDE